jgi:hypothetical protein
MVATYLRSAKADTVGKAYLELDKASALNPAGTLKTNAELESSIKTIEQLLAQTGDDTFALDALVTKGSLALRSAELGKAEGARTFLPQAQEAFEEIVNKHKDHALHYGRALAGLYQVEAQGFAYDQDPQRKERAEKYLEMLRDDARLTHTPLHAMAVDTLNGLDRIFSTVTFPNRPVVTIPERFDPQPSVTIRPIEVPDESEASSAEEIPSAPADAAPQEPAPPEPSAEPPTDAAPEEPAADEAAPAEEAGEAPDAAGTNG